MNNARPSCPTKQFTLVTGANGGISQHVIHHLLKHGEENLIFHYRGSRENLDNTILKFGLDPARSYQADLCDEGSVLSLKTSIERDFGIVTRLVNVAGSSSNAMCWKLETSEFSRVLSDNVLSAFHCTKVFAPKMREVGFGRIINFSSIVGATGIVGASHYAAAKAAINGFTKSVALELAPKGITANALALGYFDTGLIHTIPDQAKKLIVENIPTGRFGAESDVGAVVEFILSEHSSFLTGQIIHLNGGQY